MCWWKIKARKKGTKISRNVQNSEPLRFLRATDLSPCDRVCGTLSENFMKANSSDPPRFHYVTNLSHRDKVHDTEGVFFGFCQLKSRVLPKPIPYNPKYLFKTPFKPLIPLMFLSLEYHFSYFLIIWSVPRYLLSLRCNCSYSMNSTKVSFQPSIFIFCVNVQVELYILYIFVVVWLSFNVLRFLLAWTSQPV